MLGFASEIGASAFRLWVAAGAAALLFAFCMVAFFRQQISLPFRAGLVILGAVFGAAVTWVSLDPAAVSDSSAERRSLELRADELGARALAPGSPLACLDALVGESVETACEKALFASPASVASASSYVAARFALLAGMASLTQRGGGDVENTLAPLRRALEADPFGFLAHVLAVRDGCTSQNCRKLALLHDGNRVRANLDAQVFERYLDRYQEVWAKPPEAETAQAQSAATAQPPPHHLVNIDFPSAASIPAVSIMNPEPTGPVLPGVAAAAAANPNPQQTNAASRRSHKPAAPAQTLVQPGAPGMAATEPIWPEPMPPAPQTQPVPAAGAPVQLNPSPSASAAPPARPQ